MVVQTSLGRVLYRARRYDESIADPRKAVALDPDRMFTHIFLGMAHEGSCAEASNEFGIVQTLRRAAMAPALHMRKRCVAGPRMPGEPGGSRRPFDISGTGLVLRGRCLCGTW